MALQRENALRRAKSAESALRRQIRGHDSGVDAHVRAEVRPRGVNRAARKNHGRKCGVRAAVDREIDVHREQLAVARDGRAMPRARRMALRSGGHVFGAVVNNFHRLARFPRQQRGVARDHRRIFLLAAESAAGLRLHHAYFFRRANRTAPPARVHVVRALQRTPHGHAALADSRSPPSPAARCKAAPARPVRYSPSTTIRSARANAASTSPFSRW